MSKKQLVCHPCARNFGCKNDITADHLDVFICKVEEWIPFGLSSLQSLNYAVFVKWQIQAQNPKMATFRQVIFLISPLVGSCWRDLGICWPKGHPSFPALCSSRARSWLSHHTISSSPGWGKVWTLCISTQSRRRRSQKVQAAMRHTLSFGCSHRWWLCAHVPGKPTGHRCLSAGRGARTTHQRDSTKTKALYRTEPN